MVGEEDEVEVVEEVVENGLLDPEVGNIDDEANGDVREDNGVVGEAEEEVVEDCSDNFV